MLPARVQQSGRGQENAPKQVGIKFNPGPRSTPPQNKQAQRAAGHSSLLFLV